LLRYGKLAPILPRQSFSTRPAGQLETLLAHFIRSCLKLLTFCSARVKKGEIFTAVL
jgi:hypothetical protein